MDGAQNLLCEFVLLQAVAKAQDAALIGQAGECIGLGKLAVQRGVEEGLLHTGI